MRLKKPEVKELNEKSFVDGGKEKAEKNLVCCTFRFRKSFVELLDKESEIAGGNRSLILKAAISGWCEMDADYKNRLLIESMKM